MKLLLLLSLLGQLEDERYEVREKSESQLSAFPFTEDHRIAIRSFKFQLPEGTKAINRVYSRWTNRLADRLVHQAGFSVWPSVDDAGISAVYEYTYERDRKKLFGTLYRHANPCDNQGYQGYYPCATNTEPYVWHRNQMKAAVTRFLTETDDTDEVRRVLKIAKTAERRGAKVFSIFSIKGFMLASNPEYPYTVFSPVSFASNLIVEIDR